MRLLPLLCISFFLSNCDNNKSEKTEDAAATASDLIGEWNNVSLKVDINSKNNTDSADVFEAAQPHWEEKLKIRPIRTFFRADSTWNSAHYNLKDSLVYNPSGKWWIDRDQLVMMQDFPSPDTTSYLLTISRDTATFDALLDWDSDGKKDDHYFGRQVKVKR